MTRLGAALAAAAICCAASNAQPPAEAFGSLPFLDQPELSPDGKHFVAVQELDGKPAAVIYTVGAPAGTPPAVFASSDWLVDKAFWAKNDRVIMFTKSAIAPPLVAQADSYTFYRSISLDVGGKNWVQMFSNNFAVGANGSTAEVVDKDLDDPDTILMPLWATGAPDGDYDALNTELMYNLYAVDVRTGDAHLRMTGARRGGVWFADGHGHAVARVEETPQPLTDHLKLYRDGSWKEVRQFDAEGGRGANVSGMTFDGKSLAYATIGPAGRDALMRLDLDGGATGDVLFADPRYDLSAALTEEWTGRVIGAAYVADKREYVYFDPARAALQRGIEAVFPGKDAHAVSVTRDGSKAIVAVEAPDLPRTYYFLDRDSHVATKVASQYPGLSAADLGTMRADPYKARDGLDIPAYLTLPPGKAPKNLPVVVLPHGGPDARDAIGFDWWAQFLANRGYAVFQPNYRGSKGYGRAFTDAGLHQWGLKMQDDVTDGVKKLIADGIADPKRICIVGASYGGYVALAGATFTPDLYACAVSISGVSDLGRMVTHQAVLYGRRSGPVSFWQSRIGMRGDPQLDATSPALHADQVRIPVLLMHGRHDTTVAFAQSEEERDALARAGRTAELVTFEGDDHYMTLANTRITMLKTLEEFLKKNIGS